MNRLTPGVCLFVLAGGIGLAVDAQTSDPFNAVADEIESVRIEASVQRFEPGQSVVAGALPIHTSDYGVVTVWDPANGRAHETWDMQVFYPVPAALEFSFTYNETVGYKCGADGFLSQPDVPMESARIGASQKELWLSNPGILLAYGEAGDSREIGTDERPLEERHVRLAETDWSVRIDRDTALPVSVSVVENDPHKGRIENLIEFGDWRQVDGIPFPFRLEQSTGGQLVRREIRRSIRINPENAEALLTLAAGDLPPGDSRLHRWGWEMSHIFMKRAGGGGPVDRPQIDNVALEMIGDGVFLVPGTHNGLVIVGPDGLALVDAPWYPERSGTLLAMLAERWPDRPVRYLILSHHHIDHTGGLRPVVESGATVVSSEKNARYFREIFESTMDRSVRMVEVGESADLPDTGRDIQVYEVVTSHAEGMIAAFVPDEKLLFNADLFSPNRPLQFSLWFDELMNAIDFHGIDVEKHVGGHGSGVAAHPVDTAGHTMQVRRLVGSSSD